MESYPLKRISLMIGEHHFKNINDLGLSKSGLVRALLDDHFSEHKVVFSVSEKAAKLYHEIVSNTGAKDSDIEPYFVEALEKMLADKIKQMEKLKKTMERKK